MEVHVAEASGLPEGTILSIRAGTTRRQAPLPVTEPFRFPNLPFNAQNFKVDVMQTLGVARLDLNPLEMGASDLVTLPIPLLDGSEASIQFSVREEPMLCGKRAAELKQFEMMRRDGTDDENVAGSQEEKLRAAMEARAYARQHNLNGVVQEMLQYILRSKPEAPYSMMADYFRSKAEEMGEAIGSPGGNAEWSGGGAAASRGPHAPVRNEVAGVDDGAVGVGGDIVDLPEELLDDGPPLAEATSAVNVLEQALIQEDEASWVAQDSVQALPDNTTAGLDMERLKLEAEHVQLRKERAHLLRELADIEAKQAAQCTW
mmetsp:Transcript_43818/g.80013  ORF Transcript_43818/g.80013 Transcript_43818/m.80013 type:complete len:317 (-) Transcript_43818:49-999(-)